MARDYDRIASGLYLLNNVSESTAVFSKAKGILQSLEDETGYHYPLYNQIDEHLKFVSEAQNQQAKGS
jgi:hypothetical protein